MDNIPDGYSASRFRSGFLDAAGPYFVKPDGNGQRVAIRIGQGHINHVSLAHGGVLSTLADVSMSLQIHDSEDPPIPVVTLSMTVNFVAGAKLGDWVEADAQIDRMGKNIAYCSARIVAKDRLLMTASGVFSLLRK